MSGVQWFRTAEREPDDGIRVLGWWSEGGFHELCHMDAGRWFDGGGSPLLDGEGPPAWWCDPPVPEEEEGRA